MGAAETVESDSPLSIGETIVSPLLVSPQNGLNFFSKMFLKAVYGRATATLL